MTPRQNLRGALYLCLAMGAFGVLDACIKILSAHYSSMQVVTLRGLSSLPLALIWVMWRGTLSSLFRVRWRLHLVRGLLGIVMIWSLSQGLRELPMTQVYAIFFTAPLMMAILSGPILGEKAQASHWIALALGLIGVLIAMRPQNAGWLSWAVVAVMLTALSYSLSNLISRLLSRTDSVESQVVWMLVALASGSALFSFGTWQPVRIEDYLPLALLASMGLIGQIAITQAFKWGQPSAIAPFEYTALLWSISLDIAIWAQWPDAATLTGAGVIVASGVWLLKQERKQGKLVTEPPTH